MAKAVFLDRDGTLNADPGYLNDADQLELLPGVPMALRSLQEQGYLLVVVSNQSGVNRGLITMDQIRAIHERLDQMLSVHGVRIARYELCFHRPDEDCECRKPKATLILNACEALGIDPRQSFMVGDKASDVEAGHRAGCKASILLAPAIVSAPGVLGKGIRPEHIALDLAGAVEWISRHA